MGCSYKEKKFYQIFLQKISKYLSFRKPTCKVPSLQTTGWHKPHDIAGKRLCPNIKELFLSQFLEICRAMLKKKRSQIGHVSMNRHPINSNRMEEIYTPLFRQLKTINVFLINKPASNAVCKIHKQSSCQQYT